MGKLAPSKKPPAPSVNAREPMTLGNMRSFGPRSLNVTCSACGHRRTFNVDAWPDDVLVTSFGPGMRCTKCRHVGAHVRPDWTHLQRAGDRATMITQPDIKAQMTAELYTALERLGADEELLASEI